MTIVINVISNCKCVLVQIGVPVNESTDHFELHATLYF